MSQASARFLAVLAAVGLFCAACGAQEKDKAESLVISSFEPGGPDVVNTAGKPVKEHATAGEYALKLDSDGKDYASIKIEDAATLKKFPDFILFKADVFNPTDQVVMLGARIDDAKSTSANYGSRYNDDYLVAPPGKSTVEINLTGIARSNAKNWSLREPMDLGALTMVQLWISPKGSPVTLYFDNVRLESSGLPKVEGLRALAFGPAKSPIYPGFERANELMLWADGAEKGWVKPEWFDNIYTPDALTGNFGGGKEFRLKLPNGTYEVQMCIDPFGLFHHLPHFAWRKVTINGKAVLDEKMSGLDYLDKVYLLHEYDDDLPGQDLWKKFIEPRNVIRKFDAEVTDGVLSVSVDADSKYGRQMCFMVVYPAAQKEAGRKFMDTLQQKRHDKFNETMIVRVPKQVRTVPDKPVVEISAQLGVRTCPAYVDEDVNIRDMYDPTQLDRPVVVHAAQGERTNAVLGVFPWMPIKPIEVGVTVSDLAGPDGTKIASSAIQVRKARVFLKRASRSWMGDLMPYILQDFKTLELQNGIARSLWFTVQVPADAKAGLYKGTIEFKRAGTALLSLPMEVTVLPFQLDKITDITMSVTGGTAGPWRNWFPDKDYEARWWQMAEMEMKNLADHGMNAVTGGPGAQLKGIKDGKAVIDYSDMDRYMELAVKYGLTMPGDSYQGFDISGLPNNYRKGGIEQNEKDAQARFGVSFKDLIKIAYGDLAEHAKAKGWPKRVYYFLDEPRVEYGSIEPAAELIKIRTEAAPGTLFSGYYSEGQGRDVYFGMMPVSIAHINAKTLELTKAGGKELWSYDGQRVRYNIGRYAFVAARAGLKGYLRNGYMYVNSQPYFDFTDDEASWCVVYPSHTGISDSAGWERTAEGVNDYRYLLTCENLIKKARELKKAQKEADAAEAYMKDTLKAIDFSKSATAQLTPPQYDEFRAALAGHIVAIRKALGG